MYPFDSCTDVTTVGTRCKQERTKFPYGNGDKCYYHDKVQAGLTGPAEAIVSTEDDEDDDY